jgi:HSP20 family protein
MALIPWKEGHPLAELREEIDSIFDNFFGRGRKEGLEKWEGAGLRSPAVDMEETDKEIIVKAEMPGLEPEDFQISLTENTLTIKGEKKEEKEEKKRNYHMIERRYGSFYRSIPLPCCVETDKVDANYRKGILEITLPKAKAEKVKQITVNVK